MGKTINLAALSRDTGISVTPIREALSQLEHAQVLQAIPNRGFVVAKLSKPEVKNLIEIVAQLEVMALEHLFDPTVEPFDHTVCLRGFRRGQAVVDVQVGTELVELVLARRSTLA